MISIPGQPASTAPQTPVGRISFHLKNGAAILPIALKTQPITIRFTTRDE